jgi:Alcohol dehydrogenase GroES-like domain
MNARAIEDPGNSRSEREQPDADVPSGPPAPCSTPWRHDDAGGVYQDTRRVEVRELPDARIEDPGDVVVVVVVVRVTSSAICGTDLHVYDGAHRRRARAGVGPRAARGRRGEVAAAEQGIQRLRDAHHLAFSFLRYCGLSLW